MGSKNINSPDADTVIRLPFFFSDSDLLFEIAETLYHLQWAKTTAGQPALKHYLRQLKQKVQQEQIPEE